MRYIWDERSSYFNFFEKIPFLRSLLQITLKNLRIWDSTSNNRVDLFISNSNFIKKRVKRYYRRESLVIHPPVNLERFRQNKEEKQNSYYFILGAFVPYKRFDLAIKAFNSIGKRLVVAGDGPAYKKLKKLCGPTVNIIKKPSQKEIVSLMRHAKAFVFPGTEDFGITAIEALASGTPLLAHKSGGALDFVQEEINGIFFEEKTESSLIKALEKLEKITFDEKKIRETSKEFSKENFKESVKNCIETHKKEDLSFVFKEFDSTHLSDFQSFKS